MVIPLIILLFSTCAHAMDDERTPLTRSMALSLNTLQKLDQHLESHIENGTAFSLDELEQIHQKLVSQIANRDVGGIKEFVHRFKTLPDESKRAVRPYIKFDELKHLVTSTSQFDKQRAIPLCNNYGRILSGMATFQSLAFMIIAAGYKPCDPGYILQFATTLGIDACALLSIAYISVRNTRSRARDIEVEIDKLNPHETV